MDIVNLTSKLPEFSYTGQHSMFYLYPKFSNLVLNIHMKSYRKVSMVNGSYAVMDKNLICSDPSYHVTPKPSFVYHIRNKYTLLSYSLQTRKTHQINIQTMQLATYEYIAYDVPGVLANPLKNHPIIKCSTFQCIFQMLIKKYASNINFYMGFYSKFMSISESKRLRQGIYFFIDLPNKKCLNYVCVLSFHAEYEHQANVTVNKIIQDGFYQTCIYSGIEQQKILTVKVITNKQLFVRIMRVLDNSVGACTLKIHH